MDAINQDGQPAQRPNRVAGNRNLREARRRDENGGGADPRRPVVAQPLLARLPPPGTLMRMDDPLRMVLTRQELEWAHQIKDAIEGAPEIDNLSDFKYAQLALIEPNNVQSALERVRHLQTFREEYTLRDSLVEGLMYLKGLVELFPTYLLSFAFDDVTTGSYVCIYNFKGFSTKAMDTPEKIKTWICACYYILTSFCPDFESIRKGVVVMAECEGYDWSKSFDVKTYQKFWFELGMSYPLHFRQLKHFHCGVFINLLYSLTKKILPPHISSRFDMGCQFEGKLDEIYLMPTVEAANQRLLDRMAVALQKRYLHDYFYALPPKST